MGLPSTQTQQRPTSFISNRTLFAPFGRYEGAKSGAPIPRWALMGRKLERATLLAWLLERGATGAYLITGARGVGKTTFVNDCLETYEGSVHERYLQSRAPRYVLFGVIQALLVLAIGSFSLLYAAYGAHLLVNELGGRDPLQQVGLCLLAAPLLGIALAPAVYGARVAIIARGSLSRPIAITLWFKGIACVLVGIAALCLGLGVVPFFSRGWLAAIGTFALVVMIACAEYVWILSPTPAPGGSPARQATFLWGLYRYWLPVLTIRVNLGYDDLNQTVVVRSMLSGLADAFVRKYLSLSSPLGFLRRAQAAAMLIIVASLLAKPVSVAPFRAIGSDHTCNSVDYPSHASEKPPAFAKYWCAQLWKFNDPSGLLEPLLPHAPQGLVPVAPASSLVLYRTSDLVTLLLLAFLSRVLLWGPGASRPRRLYRRIRTTLQGLDSTFGETRTEPHLEVSGRGVTVQGEQRSLQIDTPRLDPRQVELHLLRILGDVTKPAAELPLGKWFMPGAQVVFVFDELDKVGANRGASGETATSGHESAAAAGSGYFSGERTRRVHQLFSEMKNLVSVAPAGFVFIGGEELHDEWLADRTARRPLLSNVFDGEIYLPSLLVDSFLRKSAKRESDSVQEHATRQYLQFQADRAFSHLRRHENIRRIPVELGSAHKSHEPGDASTSLKFSWLTGVQGDESPDRTEFLELFIRYMTIVGRGNPKRLDTILAEFIEPEPPRDAREGKHALVFHHVDRLRIRMLARIYGRLKRLLEEREDDKAVQSVLYLSEFLFKFHRRAFSWSNMERVDELLDVHRAPDVRQLLGSILVSWSQSFIAPILNGVYAFRFRSDVAAEIRYISKNSGTEMASFNFTLDESQQLKREYTERLKRAKVSGDDGVEIRVALGELYDFEEDYEQARNHYLAAMATLDEALQRQCGSELLESLNLKSDGRTQLNWSIPRLLLLLRIGLTYERGRDYRSAFIYYRNARTIGKAIADDLVKDDSNPSGPWHETLRQLQIALQPTFACAWISEKSQAEATSGHEIVARAVLNAEKLLRGRPFTASRSDVYVNAGAFFFMRGFSHLPNARSCYAAAVHNATLALHAETTWEQDKLYSIATTRRVAAALLGLADTYLAHVDVCKLKDVDIQLFQEELEAAARDSNSAMKRWLGPAPSETPAAHHVSDAQLQNPAGPNCFPVEFERREIEPHEGLIAYSHLQKAAIALLERGGLYEEAARECIRHAEIATTITWAIIALEALDWSGKLNSEKGACVSDDAFDRLCEIAVHLLSSGSEALHTAMRLCGTELPSHKDAVESSMRLVALRCALKSGPDMSKRLAQIVNPEPAGDDLTQMVVDVRKRLQEEVEQPRSSLLNLVSVIRALLIDEAVLALRENRAPTIEKCVEELRELNDAYDSPGLFTAFLYGSALGLIAAAGKPHGRDLKQRELERMAVRILHASRGSHSRQQPYFDLIEGMYFLDDAFSDREIHSRHACQMFGDGLAERLCKHLEASHNIMGPIQALLRAVPKPESTAEDALPMKDASHAAP